MKKKILFGVVGAVGNMRTLLITAAFLAFGAFLVSAVVSAAPSLKASALPLEFVEEVFVDYKNPTHAGPGLHPSTESSDFQLVQGGIRWSASTTAVEYIISGDEDVTGGDSAIEAAEATWDGFITARTFTHNESTTQTNPCTTTPNEVEWASIDGSGEILATASVCRNVATKEIVGFVIKVDTGESWTANGTTTTAFDVENVVSHEWGHVAGLGHDNQPRSGCLSMYKFAGEGETQKRTLGLGDKLGMDVLYGLVDTTAGSCGS